MLMNSELVYTSRQCMDSRFKHVIQDGRRLQELYKTDTVGQLCALVRETFLYVPSKHSDVGPTSARRRTRRRQLASERLRCRRDSLNNG